MNSVERLVALAVGALIIAFVIALVWRGEEVTGNLAVFSRIIISLSAAILGATIPGFLNIGWKGGGLVVRAGGALALFVLTFMYTPKIYEPEKAAININQENINGDNVVIGHGNE